MLCHSFLILCSLFNVTYFAQDQERFKSLTKIVLLLLEKFPVHLIISPYFIVSYLIKTHFGMILAHGRMLRHTLVPSIASPFTSFMCSLHSELCCLC